MQIFLICSEECIFFSIRHFKEIFYKESLVKKKEMSVWQ